MSEHIFAHGPFSAEIGFEIFSNWNQNEFNLPETLKEQEKRYYSLLLNWKIII